MISTNTIVRVAGIILICVGVHYGMSWPLPLIVFGAGLAMLFL